MFVSRKKLEDHGINVELDEKGLFISAMNPWPTRTIKAWQHVAESLDISDRLADEIAFDISDRILVEKLSKLSK
jgi:hypothetical protein